MRGRSIALVGLVITGCLAGRADGASVSEQRQALSRAATALRAAERLADAGRHEDAAEMFAEAQEAMQAIAGEVDSRLERTFARGQERLAEAHEKLTAAGVDLPPLESRPAEPDMDTDNAPSAPGDRMARVSFAEHVAPLLVGKCGTCHVDQSRGGVSMTSYATLMQDSDAGPLIERGSGMESLLIDVLAAGQMPPPTTGVTVSPAEVRMLVDWINQGAEFDGEDQNQPLGQLSRGEGRTGGGATGGEMSRPPIAKATGEERVSFSLDVAPLLLETCIECHGDGRSRAGLSLATFEQLWQGGDSGAAVVPGEPTQSLLLQKLRGTAEGARMPQGRPPWSDDQLALVETWIAEGAKFDGHSATEPLARVAALVRAQRSTPEELSADRAAMAADEWRLAIPDEPASQATSEQFLVVGNLPESALQQVATTCEAAAADVLRFANQADQPLNKGRITIYAFAKRIDYSEFGTMVEQRQLPAELKGHSRFDLLAPYVAVDCDEVEADALQRLLTTEIAALWVADRSQGRLPAWYVDGAARAITARLMPRNEEVRRWRLDVPEAVARLTEPNAFMTGQLPPEQTGLLAFGFVDALLQKRNNFDRLLDATGQGHDFEAACQEVFRRSPDELATLWTAAQRRGR